MSLNEELNAYRPLCDVEGCKQTAGLEPVEVVIKTRFATIPLKARIYPCKLHKDQIERLT